MNHPKWYGGRQFKKLCTGLSASKGVTFNLNNRPVQGVWVGTDGETEAQGCEINQVDGASLVAQWLRICLLMQGTRVRALVWEDPTCHGAAGPVSHNC